MRRFYVFSAILLSMVVALHSLPPLPADAGGTSAKSLVSSFYTWYFKTGFKLYQNLAQQEKNMDPFLYEQLLKAAPAPGKDTDFLDWDPFICAQIYANSFSVGEEKVSGDSAKVPVTIVYEHNGGKKTITVVLKKSAGEWKIADIIDPGNNSLISSLKIINKGKK